MKKETTYRLSRNDLRKLEGQGQTQTRKETTPLTILETLFKWRKLGIIIAAGTAIAVAGELGGFASKPEVAPAPVAVAVAAPTAAQKQAAVKAEEAAAEARLAKCAKDDVEAAICDRYLEALAQIEDQSQGDSYGQFLDRQAQRNNDLAYCRQNPSDWSCTDGQYRGQY